MFSTSISILPSVLHSINLVCIYLKSSTNLNAPVYISSNRIYHLSSCSTYSSIYPASLSPPLFAHCSDCLSRVTAWKIKTRQRPKTSASVQGPEGNCSDWSQEQLEGLADGVKTGQKGETEKEGWSRGRGEVEANPIYFSKQTQNLKHAKRQLNRKPSRG